MLMMTMSTIIFFLSMVNSYHSISIGLKECNEMIKAVECFPKYDKELFNEIFIHLYDINELKLLQAKGLDYFADNYNAAVGQSYCKVFLKMLTLIETTLSYDIYIKNSVGDRDLRKKNQELLHNKGWYESLTYIRLLPTNITSKCEVSHVALDGTHIKREERQIIDCIDEYRRKTLRLSIANKITDQRANNNDNV